MQNKHLKKFLFLAMFFLPGFIYANDNNYLNLIELIAKKDQIQEAVIYEQTKELCEQNPYKTITRQVVQSAKGVFEVTLALNVSRANEYLEGEHFGISPELNTLLYSDSFMTAVSECYGVGTEAHNRFVLSLIIADQLGTVLGVIGSFRAYKALFKVLRFVTKAYPKLSMGLSITTVGLITHAIWSEWKEYLNRERQIKGLSELQSKIKRAKSEYLIQNELDEKEVQELLKELQESENMTPEERELINRVLESL